MLLSAQYEYYLGATYVYMYEYRGISIGIRYKA